MNTSSTLKNLVLRSVPGGEYAFHVRLPKSDYGRKPELTWYVDGGYDPVTSYGAKRFLNPRIAREWLSEQIRESKKRKVA